jgi:hypothetical protein
MNFDDSGRDGYVVTPSDTALLPKVADFLYVAVTGNVAFVTEQGTLISLLSVPAFTKIPWRARKVMSTGTTATVVAATH